MRGIAARLAAGATAIVVIIALSLGLPAAAVAGPPSVFAAASLKTALDRINDDWRKQTDEPARLVYAASSALARQIEAGAPADIFISADRDWMNYLAEKGLIRAGSRVDLLGNHLVLIAPKGSAIKTVVEPGFPLTGLLGNGRLAVGAVDAVPAGRYAKAALVSLGVWDAVKDKLAQAENVRAALALVARGEAPLGIVYQTDAAIDPDVVIVGTFPDDCHPPIIYPAAIVTSSTSPQARAFLDDLRSPAAARVFEQAGFSVLK
jgi:molybdate transport system substrate-binding protein